MMVEIKEIVKYYGNIKAVDGVSFGVEKGEIFGLLGPNGAGKTTVISMICGILRPDSGDIRFEGNSVVKEPLVLRRVMGIVPQEIALYPELTARENLNFWGRMYGLSGKALKKRIDDVLDMMGLSDRANDRIDKYSGGMKRRINIAAALLHNPELLIMDEPTVGIDPQSRNHILETVKRLEGEGMTVIYTSHYMEEVEYLCDRVAIMDQGKIIAVGGQDELRALVGGIDRVIVELAMDREGLYENLKALNFVQGVSRNGEVVEVLMHDARAHLVELISSITGYGGDIVSVKVEEPNLESVFLHLTGRKLR